MEREFYEKRKHFSQENLQKVLSKEKALKGLFTKENTLSGFFNDFKLLFSLLKDYFSGRYKNVPWKTIATIGATLLYVLSAVDLIPDIIPFVGFFDDATVFAFCLKMIAEDLQQYRLWRDEKNILPE